MDNLTQVDKEISILQGKMADAERRRKVILDYRELEFRKAIAKADATPPLDRSM